MQNIVKCFGRPEDGEQRVSYTCTVEVPFSLVTLILFRVVCILDEYLLLRAVGLGHLSATNNTSTSDIPFNDNFLK